IDQWSSPYAILAISFVICFACLFAFVYIFYILFTFGNYRMEIKIENNLLFDVSKICRVCLSEKEQMRSVFMQDESTGQSMILAEMLMGFSAVQMTHQ
ncbi:unnamed protein product, partial [Callosobruchus maculatus]